MQNEVTKLYSAQLVLKAQWKLVYRWSSMLGVSGTVQIGWPQRLTCFNPFTAKCDQRQISTKYANFIF